MTLREMLTAVVEGNITEEVTTKASEEISKLDARNAKRKGEESKKAKENAPIKESIAAVLTDEPQTASDIAKTVGISVQKASSLLRQMDVTVTEVKVKGKGTQKAYSL